MYCKFRKEYLTLIEILFDIHVYFPCNCIFLQRCCHNFSLSNKIDKHCFHFIIVTALFCLFYFTCHNQWQSIYLNISKNWNSSWTCIQLVRLLKFNFRRSATFKSPQTSLMRYHVSQNTLHCPGTPLEFWRYRCLRDHSVIQMSLLLKKLLVMNLLVSRKPLRYSIR